MHSPLPVYLFTDFGWAGPYVGQLCVALQRVDARLSVTHLMHDAPAMRPDLAAYLLPAVCARLPQGLVLAVVDPGVGGDREALIVETPRLTYVGPDNGLLAKVGDIRAASRITWRPQALSASFHGRDIFAPVAARLACGEDVAGEPIPADALVGADWPVDLARVVYIDGYGNAMTGVGADRLSPERVLVLGKRVVRFAETFCRAEDDTPFWYRNSQGLVEIAIKGGSAARRIDLALGTSFLID